MIPPRCCGWKQKRGRSKQLVVFTSEAQPTTSHAHFFDDRGHTAGWRMQCLEAVRAITGLGGMISPALRYLPLHAARLSLSHRAFTSLSSSRRIPCCRTHRYLTSSSVWRSSVMWEGVVTSRVQGLLEGVCNGNRASLAEAITLGKVW